MNEKEYRELLEGLLSSVPGADLLMGREPTFGYTRGELGSMSDKAAKQYEERDEGSTLLSLLTGGRYVSSEDLPTIPETAHSFIDQIKESYDQQQQRDVQIQGQGLGLLDMVGGVAKAGALIPAFTKQYVKSKSGQSQVADIIKKIARERDINKAAMTTPKGLLKSTFKDVITAKPSKLPTKKGVEGFELGGKENIMNQVYQIALEQYKLFGAARPGT